MILVEETFAQAMFASQIERNEFGIVSQLAQDCVE
jgi:hypothetical protein